MMSVEKKILIADDHELIRGGLRQVLDMYSAGTILEATNGIDAMRLIQSERLDVAILDVEMPGMTGFEVARSVKDQGLSVDVIFLTMYKDESMFNKAMDIGVKGYVLKENTITEILQCLKAVLAGRYFLSPGISDFLIRRNSRLSSPASDKLGLDLLTATESRVLRQLAQMKTSKEIADDMNISVKTVQNHRNNICIKLELQGAHALLRFAVDNIDRL
jgi:DNA-binding NarL/FixJ family response regulator